MTPLRFTTNPQVTPLDQIRKNRPGTNRRAVGPSKPVLEGIQNTFGFIPNLMAIFANNPTVLHGYLALHAAYEKVSVTPRELQLILLAATVENHCNYSK